MIIDLRNNLKEKEEDLLNTKVYLSECKYRLNIMEALNRDILEKIEELTHIGLK